MAGKIGKTLAKPSEGNGTTLETERKKFGKSDPRYWEQKVFKPVAVNGGNRIESAHYSVRIMFKGRRESFPLKLGAKREAGKRAAEIYISLLNDGWGKTLERFGHATDISGEVTLGALFEAVSAVTSVRAGTFHGYCNALRKIAGDIEGVEGDNSRYDYKTGGAAKRREKIDRIKLRELTDLKVEKWKKDYVQAKGAGDPQAERRARTSVNSLLLQARSLFSEKVVKTGSDGGKLIEYENLEGEKKRLWLPNPLPMEGVKLFKKRNERYVSKIDAKDLLAAAMEELGSPSPLGKEERLGMSILEIQKHERSEKHKPEAFKILLLALLAGLRRNEIDKLLWEQIDMQKGEIEIRTTRYFRPKSEDSAGKVELDPELVELLRGFRASATGEFVIESGNPAGINQPSARYRAERSFRFLRDWLSAHGVESRAIHTLRKEFGSLICQRLGIYAASRALRHAGIGITVDHYVDKKGRVTVGLGSVLKPNVIEFKKEQKA